jgi:hypothetical protein
MPKPLPKLSEILGETKAEELLKKVSTYDGWHEEFTSGERSILKGDSNSTTRIKKDYKALSNYTPDENFDANPADDVNKYLHQLKEVRELTKKWLENKMDNNSEAELKKHARFLPMLALDTMLEQKIKILTPSEKSVISDAAAYNKKTSPFANMHSKFTPPSTRKASVISEPVADMILVGRLESLAQNFIIQINETTTNLNKSAPAAAENLNVENKATSDIHVDLLQVLKSATRKFMNNIDAAGNVNDNTKNLLTIINDYQKTLITTDKQTVNIAKIIEDFKTELTSLTTSKSEAHTRPRR